MERFGTDDIRGGEFGAALDFPDDRVLDQIGMTPDILTLGLHIAQCAKRVECLVRAGEIGLGFLHDASEALKCFAMGVDSLQNPAVERNAAHVLEPGDPDSLEAALHNLVYPFLNWRERPRNQKRRDHDRGF